MGIELKHILKCALIPACLTLLFAIVTRLCFIGFSGEFFFVVAPAICLVLSAFATPVTCIWAGAVRFKRGLFQSAPEAPGLCPQVPADCFS